MLPTKVKLAPSFGMSDGWGKKTSRIATNLVDKIYELKTVKIQHAIGDDKEEMGCSPETPTKTDL